MEFLYVALAISLLGNVVLMFALGVASGGPPCEREPHHSGPCNGFPTRWCPMANHEAVGKKRRRGLKHWGI